MSEMDRKGRAMDIDDELRTIRETLPDTLADVAARLEEVARRMEVAADIVLREGGRLPSIHRAPRPQEEIERRRAVYRPSQVRILLVAPPIPDPPEPTDFYLVNSHLYRCIRAAFVVMTGERSVPTGEAFLDYFKAHGCWLVAMPPALRRERGRPSNDAHAAELAYLTGLLRETRPRHAVGLKPRIGRLIREAVGQADLPVRGIESVRVPKDLWQDKFVRRLRAMIDDGHTATPVARPGSGDGPVAGDPTVTLDAVVDVLRRNRNRRMRVYHLAEAIAVLGTEAEKVALRSQIRRLLKQERGSFDLNGAGIRLAAEGAGSPPATSA
jgi:hypothetical protein